MRILDLWREGAKEEIWRRTCGFVDRSVEESLELQKNLLAKQLAVLQRSELVRRLAGGSVPASVEEFRERMPLTTYEDYAAALLERREDMLPEKPAFWLHTSGRSGEYRYKWIPWTSGMDAAMALSTFAVFILPACRERGHVPLREGDRFIFSLAPLPYISGLVMKHLHEQFAYRIFPPYEQAVQMDFSQRIARGVEMALSEGIDYFYGITAIMLRISEELEAAAKADSTKAEQRRRMMRNPKVVLRLLRGLLRARLAGRGVLPKDLWKVKGIMCSGMDSFVYRERIKRLWGRYPWEAYGSTEFGFAGLQHWGSPGLVLTDSANYWEFLPLPEYQRWKQDRSYRPRLLLLDELEQGGEYVLVGTNFHGGVLTRYVIGDSLKVIALGDPTTGLRLPQFAFASRVDDVIDIGGFTRLTEKTLWIAIEASGVDYIDWVASKEYSEQQPVLQLYLEPKGAAPDPEQVAVRVHEKLRELDEPYREMEAMAGIRPVRVSFLSRGTFSRYAEAKRAAGADLAHLKPQHVNPRPEIVQELLSMSRWTV